MKVEKDSKQTANRYVTYVNSEIFVTNNDSKLTTNPLGVFFVFGGLMSGRYIVMRHETKDRD